VRNAYRTEVEKSDGVSPLEELVVRARVILKWSLSKWDVVVGWIQPA
jgi:hypothetical protein